MSKRSTPTIQGQFQTKRSRLLYFIYTSKGRKIKSDSGIKSKLRRAFDYSSDGHLYHDLEYLKRQGLLEEKDGYYKVTRKGAREFTLVSTLWIAAWTSLVLGAYILILAVLQIMSSVVFVGPQFVVMLGIMMFGFGALYWLSLKDFRPRSPSSDEEEMH